MPHAAQPRSQSIAASLLRRLTGASASARSCPVCDQPIAVDPHCVRLGDAFVHAHCALYRRRVRPAA